MPRTRGSRPRQHITPTRLVDGTGLEDRLTQTIIGEFVTPIEVRVTEIEAELAALDRGDTATAEVELRAGGQGGTVFVKPEEGFTADAIGRPVIVNQAPNGDADEGGIVQFTGEVIDSALMRLRWFSASGAPERVTVVYLIG